ncbi:MAG: RidA family protein [Parvibaculaceae bacterium]|nr:RidA family protein [Parvibaculaceae bacterium]
MTIRRIGSNHRMSEAVVYGNMVYLAGQVAKDASQSITGQAEQVLAGIDALLAEAGTDKSKILTATVWLTDMGDFAAFNKVWDAWVDQKNPPARACVQSPLVLPDWKLEIQLSAAV